MIITANKAASGIGKDTYRIRIWDKDSGQVVYDTMPGAADNLIPVTPLLSGSIKLTP